MMSIPPRNGRELRVLGPALAVINLALWFGVVWLRDGFDALAGRLHFSQRPSVCFGVQELLVYYDPWLACFVFPVVYTLGFAAIPFLFQPAKSATGEGSGSTALAILLLGFEMVWVFLIAFAVLCRGPNWNFYWPWEAWQPKIVPLNLVHFSSIFWYHMAGQRVSDAPWVLREAPGLVLAVGYLSLGLIVSRSLARGTGRFTASGFFLLLMLFALTPLSIRRTMVYDAAHFNLNLSLSLLVFGLAFAGCYLCFRLLSAWGQRKASDLPMPYWRCLLLVLLVQLAALVPAKILLYWLFGMKYFLFLPEYTVNI